MTLNRAARHEAGRQEILRACWLLAAENGLVGFTLRQVAAAVGIRAPSLYSYFDSKEAMYDAMFAAAAQTFDDAMSQVRTDVAPRELLRAVAHAYVQFCVDDPVRHQLLFQRTIPDFTPTPEAYRPAIKTYDRLRSGFATLGIVDPRDLDLWTALLSGLAAQQMANDPGGTRWTDLTDDAADMFYRKIGQQTD